MLQKRCLIISTVVIGSFASKKGIPGRALLLRVWPGLGWVVLNLASYVTGSPIALLLIQPNTFALL